MTKPSLFVAQNMTLALRQVREALGSDAMILSSQTIEGQVHIHATQEISKTQESSFDSLFAQSEKYTTSSLQERFPETCIEHTPQNTDHHISDQITHYLKTELDVIKNLFHGQLEQKTPLYPPTHMHYTQVVDLLCTKGFSIDWVKRILSDIPSDKTPEEIIDVIINKIVDDIFIEASTSTPEKKTTLLMGASGCGKTYLMSQIIMQKKPTKPAPAMIFANRFSIKTLEECKIYSRVFKSQAFYVETSGELEAAYHTCQHHEQIFIDLPPYDFNNMENNFYLDFVRQHLANINVILVVANHCRIGLIERYLSQFSGIIQGLAITKCDEYEPCEELINLSIKHRIPIRYLSFGPASSQQLIEATPEYFFNYLYESLSGRSWSVQKELVVNA